ncbi:hypothetical protein J1N35_000491 [Gossypium stocksii]|uniref:Uncharacterized protein n=1 Tax=Gossypium stocksii TaxID=47602 RepID=A0A9D3WIH6_9ROSI|nr:hypothetical protein J1N35_000491 [Gossypium stocksii]
MHMREAYSERIARRARDISSHESRGVCDPSLHIPKEFVYRGARGLAGNPKQYTCSTCWRPAQNVSPINSRVKSMNSKIKS